MVIATQTTLASITKTKLINSYLRLKTKHKGRRQLIRKIVIYQLLVSLADLEDNMAVRQRLFNSTAPFTGPPKADLKGTYPSCSNAEQETEEAQDEGKDGKMGFTQKWSADKLTKLLTHGTAEQVEEMQFKTSTIVAQAECKYILFL